MARLGSLYYKAGFCISSDESILHKIRHFTLPNVCKCGKNTHDVTNYAILGDAISKRGAP